MEKHFQNVKLLRNVFWEVNQWPLCHCRCFLLGLNNLWVYKHFNDKNHNGLKFTQVLFFFFNRIRFPNNSWNSHLQHKSILDVTNFTVSIWSVTHFALRSPPAGSRSGSLGFLLLTLQILFSMYGPSASYNVLPRLWWPSCDVLKDVNEWVGTIQENSQKTLDKVEYSPRII